MKNHVTLLLTTSLLGIAPATLAAQNLVLVHPTGHMRIQVTTTEGDDFDVTTPITTGRIEIAEGPLIKPVGKFFSLNRLDLHFADVFIQTKSLDKKLLPMEHIGTSLRDVLVTWALESQPGVFQIDIPPGVMHITGDPSFHFGLRVSDSFFPDPNLDKPYFTGELRTYEAITGTIDRNTGTIELTVVFRRSLEKLFGATSVDLTFTVHVSGAVSSVRADAAP